jgi:Lhr-like helicase
MTDSYLIIDERKTFGQVDWSRNRPELLEGHIFSLPTQWSEMIGFFKDHLYFLVPSNLYSTYTWSLLKRLSKAAGIMENDEAWVSEILENQLRGASNTELLRWSQLLFRYGWKNTAKSFIDSAASNHEAQIGLDTQSLEQVQDQIKETALQSFMTSAKIPGQTLTSVKLQPQTAGSIMSNLGVTYDLFKMIENDSIKRHAIAFQLHTQIVTILQQLGAPKQGLPNQEPFTEKKRLTRTQLLKLLNPAPKTAITKPRKPKISKNSGSTSNISGAPTPRKGFVNEEISVDPYMTSLEKLKAVLRNFPQLVTSREEGVIVEFQLESIVDRLIQDQTLKSKDWTLLSDGILSCILNKNEYVTSEKAISRLEQNSTSTTFSLDPWQHEMVEHIRSGRSLLVVGPTSGGKTFASMSAMDSLLRTSDSSITLAYVAPTFHLALQTYANLVRSFQTVGISLITGIINTISKDTKIWVGTPSDLWSYLSATGEDFTIGIFDEIHTLSETFGEGIEAVVTSHAIANLLLKCRTQVIALSATIGDADISTIQAYLTTRTKISQIETIVYRDRFIPLVQYQYVGVDGFKELHSGALREDKYPSSNGGCPPETLVPTTMFNTFDLVKRLEKNDMLPAIIFDENEATCYDHYVSFVNWLEVQESTAYRIWHEIHDNLIDKTQDLNTTLRQAENEYHSRGPRSAALCNAASKSRESMITVIKNRIRTEILKPENVILDPLVDITQRHRNIFSLISGDGPCNGPLSPREAPRKGLCLSTDDRSRSERWSSREAGAPTPPKSFVNEGLSNDVLPTKVSALVRDLLHEWQRYNTLEVGWDGSSSAGLSTIPVPCQQMGPYFTIGTYSLDFETFKHMRNPNSAEHNQAAMKLHRFMKGLCAAERITEADVDGLLQLIDKGLRFGVGIILPTMPFIIQYELLRLLNNRKVSLIFSSRSMSMGINVPLRTVVIRSTELKSWNVCELMQMSGRGGRRRLDNQGNVIFWNVLNCLNVDVAHLPLIKIPQMEENQGSLISHPLDVAIQIEMGKAMIHDVSAVKASLGFLNPTMAYTSLDLIIDDPSSVYHSYDNVEEDGRSVNDSISSTRELSMIDGRELSSSISVCVDPIATSIGYDEIHVMDMVQRIQRLAMNKILVSDKLEVYKTAEVITLIKRGIQELHTRYHRSSNLEWLSFMANTFELLHRVTYRQLRL